MVLGQVVKGGLGRAAKGQRPGGRPDFTQEQMKEMMARMASALEKIEREIMTSVLDPDQGDRVMGLLIQRDDGRALTSVSVAEQLGLSSDQSQQVKSVIEKGNEERMTMARAAFQGGGGTDMREKFEAFDKKINADLIAVMTPEQKTNSNR